MRAHDHLILSKRSLDLAISLGLSPFRCNPPMPASEWMDRYYVLSTDAVSVRWECLPYQRAIIDAMANDDIRILTIQKSARVGYTHALCGIIGYNINHRRRNQLIYQPTDDEAEGFCKDSIDPMIANIQELGSALLKGDKKGKYNTLNRKQFAGSLLDIRGGKSPRNYRRTTKDVVMYDELDGFDRNIGGEGSAVFLGDKRLMSSSFPKSIRGSTPGLDHDSMIAESLSEADLIFYRFLPCGHCGKFIRLEWKRLRWTDKDPHTAAHLCEYCGGASTYPDYAGMDKLGRWMTPDGCYTDGIVFLGPSGERMPSPRHIGFSIWGAYSYFQTWPEIVHEFLAARIAQKRGNLSPMISFTNTVRAETWSQPGDRAEWTNIQARAEAYQMMVVPSGARLLTAGVDTQDDRLPVVVRAWGPNKESWLVYRTELYGDPIHADVWAKLDMLLYRDWDTEDGESMRVSSMAIDTGGHRTQAVYNYCRSRWPIVMALKGSSDKAAPMLGRKPSFVEVRWSGKTYPMGVRLWHLGVSRLKDDTAARLGLTLPDGHAGGPVPGYMHFPIGLDEEYYQQLCGEIRESRRVKGRETTEWVQTRTSVDAWDCENYAYAAAIRAGIELIAEKREIEAPNVRPPTRRAGITVRSRGILQ